MGVAVKAVDNLEWVVDNGTVEGVEKVGGIELVEDGHEREVDILLVAHETVEDDASSEAGICE